MKPSIKFNFVQDKGISIIVPENAEYEVITKFMNRPLYPVDLPNLYKMGFTLLFNSPDPDTRTNKSVLGFKAGESYEKTFLTSSSLEADAFFNLIGRLSITLEEMLMLIQRGFSLTISGKIKNVVQILKDRHIDYKIADHIIIVG